MTDLWIADGMALTAGELRQCNIFVHSGKIVEVASRFAPPPSNAQVIRANGMFVLPGIVDIHGDAFERQIMPRQGVTIPTDIALADTDRQLVASGITTAYHGVSFSWEPGLRGHESSLDLVRAVFRQRRSSLCDARIHLRFEIFNLDRVDEVAAVIETGLVGLLSFNDHHDDTEASLRNPVKAARYADRTGLTVERLLDLAASLRARADETRTAIDTLAASAAKACIPMMSHDDPDPQTRRRFHEIGCPIAEFPETRETAELARSLNNPIVFGAPNVLRGGSHRAMTSAADMVHDGLCTILASDYYYPSLLHASFRLWKQGIVTFPDAWRLVSRNPAEAAGLGDRGAIAAGRRADLIIVDPDVQGHAQVVSTIAGGRLVYSTARYEPPAA